MLRYITVLILTIVFTATGCGFVSSDNNEKAGTGMNDDLHKKDVLVKVLSTEGCLHTPPTIELIQKVADAQGITIKLEKIVITTPDEANEHRFIGSPTVQIEGLDMEQSARDSVYFGIG